MNIKIAIVDDNTFLIHAIKEKLSFFEELKFKFSATNGSELLQQLEDNFHIDLILMDIEMPVLKYADHQAKISAYQDRNVNRF